MRRVSILVMIAAGLALVLIAGSGVVLFRGRGGARRARMRRDSAYRELEQYHARDPFPSRENVQRAQTNMVRMRTWSTNLLARFSEGAIDAVEQSPSIFIDHLQTLSREMFRESPRYGGSPVIVPPFAFGFSAYLNDGEMPVRENVPRLTRQLRMTQRLIQIFFETGVNRVNEFERDRFEVQAGAAGERGRSSAGSSDSASWGGGMLSSEHIPADIERFNVRMQMRQQSLVTLLNQLASMKPFVVVNELRIKKSGDALRSPPVEESGEDAPESARDRFSRAALFGARGETREPAAEKKPARKLDPRQIPREERLISGPHLEPYLDVRMEIVFFNFKRDVDSARQ